MLRTIPGVGPTVAAILLAEIGDLRWYTRFSQLRKLAGLDILPWQTGQRGPLTRISKAGRALLRWALYQAALGAARTRAWRARCEALRAKRQGDRYAFFKTTVELAAKLLRLVWGVWRSGRPYEPARALPAGGGARDPGPERRRARALRVPRARRACRRSASLTAAPRQGSLRPGGAAARLCNVAAPSGDRGRD